MTPEQKEAKRAADARFRERNVAAGLTSDGKPRKRAPNGSSPKRRVRTPEQLQAARERMRAKRAKARGGGEK